MESEYFRGTLCWRCENAVPNIEGTRGCSWSKAFTPVPEWWAEKRIIMYDGHPKTSYEVILCPEFIAEKPKKDFCYYGVYG